MDWGNGVLNWWLPPPALLTLTVRKIIMQRAVGTLIVPNWRSAPFWPLIWDAAGKKFEGFVQKHFELPRENIIVKGRYSNGVFGQDPLPFSLLALKINWV